MKVGERTLLVGSKCGDLPDLFGQMRGGSDRRTEQRKRICYTAWQEHAVAQTLGTAGGRRSQACPLLCPTTPRPLERRTARVMERKQRGVPHMRIKLRAGGRGAGTAVRSIVALPRQHSHARAPQSRLGYSLLVSVPLLPGFSKSSLLPAGTNESAVTSRRACAKVALPETGSQRRAWLTRHKLWGCARAERFSRFVTCRGRSVELLAQAF